MSYYDELNAVLKDFQKVTVEHAFNMLEKNKRFLVADEVGLGKTMIAKGVIAKSMDKLKSTKKPIEIIYITTNESIASQNIETLKFKGINTCKERLSLLKTTQVSEEDKEYPQITFRSFTVGTSLDAKGAGRQDEREFIVYLLKDNQHGLLKDVADDLIWEYFKVGTDKKIKYENSNKNFDTLKTFDIADNFIEEFNMNCKGIICSEIEVEEKKNNPIEVINKLRMKLIELNLRSLNPDLIILDEFNRFFNLLKKEESKKEESNIIKTLFSNENSKILLLSATPYKLLDCAGNDEHYKEFYQLMKWLKLGNIEQLKKEFKNVTKENKEEIESILLNVMCRTERLSFASNDMVEDKQKWVAENIKISPHFIKEYKKYSLLNIPNILRYLKSAPYPLNYMNENDYVARKKFEDKEPKEKEKFKIANNLNVKSQIHPKIDLLKLKIEETHLKEFIWMPPISSYVDSSENTPSTKMLIFSKWDFVPNSIIDSISHSQKGTKTNYTDRNFDDRYRLLEISDKQYEYKGTKSILNIKKEIVHTDDNIEKLLLLASPANVIYRSILKYSTEEKEPTGKSKEKIIELAGIFLHYLGKSHNYNIIKKTYQKKKKKKKLSSSEKLKMILEYCLKHDIQAMFDEYIHILFDTPKIKSNNSLETKLELLQDTFKTIFHLRPNEIKRYNISDDTERSTRFAMRISKSATKEKTSKENNEKPLTSSNIKEAFNSPFAPFVLATTSIGQEGLDFHTYCHQIWHWEIPSNPIDLEQRDGRLKRYKNYAVRKNIAKDYKCDNWNDKFEEAKNENQCDFKTFWLYESKNKEENTNIERTVPILEYTKEYQKYDLILKQLKQYRKMLGQNKHEDINNKDLASNEMINLKPETERKRT